MVSRRQAERQIGAPIQGGDKSPHSKENGRPGISFRAGRRWSTAFRRRVYTDSDPSSFARRLRATCSRRLIVPTGEANRSLIWTSDWPLT